LDFKAKDGLVILFKKFDEGKAVYEGDISKDAMLEFIQVRRSQLTQLFKNNFCQFEISAHPLTFDPKSPQNTKKVK